MTYTIEFPCGAAYDEVKEDPRIGETKAIRKKDGALRLCIYDSQGGEHPLRPLLPNATVPPCRFGCKHKRASGRKEVRCFPNLPDEEISRLHEAGEHMGYGKLAWRYVINCYGVVSEEQRP